MDCTQLKATKLSNCLRQMMTSRSKAQLQTGKIIRFEKDGKQMKVNDEHAYEVTTTKPVKTEEVSAARESV
ncbi:hypothetical protein D5086_003177 [Populus alba]|uniref:Uncharacterized protein n=1 Tax=Populus alba TaxID=43335 RepID=A0ACC4D3S5_POPAL